jgi:hypothetical protein
MELTVDVAEQPENDNENEDGRNTTAPKFPSCCSREYSS